MAKKKARPRRRKSVRERLQAKLKSMSAKEEEARRALVAELLAQRKDIERQLKAAGHKRGRRRKKAA